MRSRFARYRSDEVGSDDREEGDDGCQEPASKRSALGAVVGPLVVLLGSFAAPTLVALAAGAPNLGTALTFGQLGFALALVLVLARY